jgi:hypothetical protein
MFADQASSSPFPVAILDTPQGDVTLTILDRWARHDPCEMSCGHIFVNERRYVRATCDLWAVPRTLELSGAGDWFDDDLDPDSFVEAPGACDGWWDGAPIKASFGSAEKRAGNLSCLACGDPRLFTVIECLGCRAIVMEAQARPAASYDKEAWTDYEERCRRAADAAGGHQLMPMGGRRTPGGGKRAI